jgi:hypothetical protein
MNPQYIVFGFVVLLLLLAAACSTVGAALAVGAWLSERGKNRSMAGLPAFGGYAAEVWAPPTDVRVETEKAIVEEEIALLADGLKQLAYEAGTPLSDEEAEEEARRALFSLDAGLEGGAP